MPDEKTPVMSFGDPEELARQKAIENAKLLAANEDKYKVPTEFVQIPSKGLVYSKDSTLYNAEEIEIKHMAAPQEDILTSLSLIRSGRVIDELLKSCMVNKAVHPEQLLLGDRNALMVAIRVTGYGPEYPVDVTCPDCGELNKEFNFDLSKLNINMLALQPAEDGMNKFSYEFPDKKNKVEFKFLTAQDSKEISDEINAMKKVRGAAAETNTTSTLKKQILSLNGDTNRGQINRFVDSLSLRNVRAFRKYLDDQEPDVIMKQNFACNSCGATNIVNVNISNNFFWPQI